jgi:gliding motility-associated-like protein
VENAIGCFDSLDQTVYVDLLRLNLPDTLVQCKGDEVYLNPVFNPRYQYLWSPANKVDDPRSPNPKAVTNETTTFTVVIQSISSDTCEAVRQVHLIVPQLISLRATGDTITCGYPIDLRASGNGQLTYTWRNSAGNVVGRTNTLRVNPTNSETFTVEAEDIYGCSESASMTVTNRQVDISAAGEIEACENGPATLSVRNLDAGDNLTYSWSPLNRIISGANTPNPVVRTDVSGLNVFFVYAQNQFGCRDTASVGLDVREFNPTYTPQTEVCPGVPTPINPGFSPDQTYTWSPAANLSNPNAANPVATLTQTTFFDVIIRQAIDTLSCVDTVRVKVDVRPPLDLRVPADTTICRQELLKLVASASGSGLNYVWSDQANFSNVLGTQAELFVSREGSHVYYVRVIDDLGCADTGQVRVNIVPIEIKLQDDTFTCRNVVSRLQVDNLNPDQTLRYSWSPLRYIVSGATTSNPEIKLDQTTTLTLQVQNQYNCSATFNFLIGVVDLDAILTIDAKPDSVLPGESSQLTLLPQDRDFSYQWTPSSTLNNITIFNPIATPEVTTTYTVEVEDENGCVASRSVTVIVYDPLCIDPYIFLPSAFSPNGDGTNDVLYLLGKYVEEMHLVIYNRWGQKVFESFKQTEGWDGTFKGELLSPDVYGFYLTVKCIDGEEYFKKGNISLLR